MEEVRPYGTSGSKREEIKEMFDNIAPTYDLLNHLLSLHVDKIWRRRTIREVMKFKPKSILDVATGTGDLAFAALKMRPEKIVGVDLSPGMIEVALKKNVNYKGTSQIEFKTGDAEDLDFQDETFDLVMAAFGVRNFEDPAKNLTEMCRVTRPGGHIAVLEFMLPRRFPVKQLYLTYFRRILPLIGKSVSKDFSAYQYLPESVSAFPQRNDFLQVLNQSGYSMGYYRSLAGGIAGLYIAEKAQSNLL